MKSHEASPAQSLMFTGSVRRSEPGLVVLLTLTLALACVTLLPACRLPGNRVIPDVAIPHQISRDAILSVYTRQADGSFVEEKVRVEKGWWVASPQVIAK